MKQKEINICTVRDWILRKIAIKIYQKHETVHKVILGYPYQAFTDVDANIYVDVSNTYHHYAQVSDSTHIGFMTHNITGEPDFWTQLHKDEGWKDLNGIVVMGKRYEEILRSEGYEGEILVAIPGNFTDLFSMSPIKLLMAQRGQGSHYGKEFLRSLIEDYPSTMLNFEFTILGDGWDDLIEDMKDIGIEVENWKDSDTNVPYPKSYQDWYGWCDYVFVPITETAGPMCLPEALACGKPVICADVGWNGKEFSSDYTFEPGNAEQCIEILRSLVKEREERRARVPTDIKWEKFATDVVNFAAEVSEKNGNS